MDVEAAARRRLRLATTHSPGRHIRNKSSAAAQSNTPPSTAVSKPRSTTSTQTRKSSEDESRHFVGNVGTGGRLYLAPSRVPQYQLIPENRSWAPKLRGVGIDSGVSVPPLSLANINRRHRSRSAGDIGVPGRNIARAVSGSSQEAEMNARESPRTGLLELEIPHYRIGTPRFSARGTPYLRSSVAASTDDETSSVMSQQAYDSLFPMPPGTLRRTSSSSRERPTHHLHPSSAARARAPRSRVSREPSANEIAAALFDQIERNYLDPANVRFSPEGQLLAASVPRLIAQITSPKFLDYELLSDFFLTYRGFLKSQDLLSWLLQRMRWAIDQDSDTGRIVRVRTFVALRHWVLNYFADDFSTSIELRLQFCESINNLAKELASRTISVPGDVNIIGELKKCWRRTSALFWPVSDALDSSATTDITAGAPLSTEESLRASLQFDTNTTTLQAPQLIAIDQRTNQKARVVSVNSAAPKRPGPRASIPASPLSEDSLQVLSCSVPFLQRIRPDESAEKRAERSAPRPAIPRRDSLSKQRDQHQQHKRTGSEPVLSRKSPLVDPEKLPNITITGGLVRGILLQPCPSMLQRSAPRSPPIDSLNDEFFDESSHGSVKRIVGRVLSVKKSVDSSNRSHHSSGSRSSNREDAPSRLTQASVPRSSISSTPRKDVLANKIQKSYDKYFSASDVRPPSFPAQGLRPLSLDEFAARLGSQITTGSRSIVIVDATSLPAPPPQLEGITEATMMPLFPSIMDAQRSSDVQQDEALGRQQTRTTQSSQSIDGRLHESFVFPPPMKVDSHELEDTFTSSAHISPQIQVQTLPKQLRRVPGGDLRAADHVHELKDDLPELTLTRSQSTSSSRPIRSPSHRVAHSVAVTDVSSIRPHVRSSFKSDAGRLAKVRAGSDTGGIEDALARLEGKPTRRRRHSGMSWLELPTSEEAAEVVDGEQTGTAFEMINTPVSGQIYRLSRIDHSDTSSFDPPIVPTYQQARAQQRASSRVIDHNRVISDTDTRKTDVTSYTQSSFLLDDNQSLSDISTDIENIEEDSVGVRSFFFDDPTDDDNSRKPGLHSAKDSAHDSTPSQSPERPPVLKVATSAAKILGVPAGSLMPDVLQSRPKRRRPDIEGHYPFVLAFESSVIAEQLCIIEKDALDEVDWKDLISLNWRQTPSQARNWADYLKHEDSNGIDLVVARFNLVVKWVVSQIILTDSTLERARCMTKFIHIAAHCLRLHNYASMTQITLALLSSDLARLTTTWSLVAPPDKKCLDHMETLCQPLRNFANLRAEMENATLSDGCIPFIGLYTHDLMYNAQKPTTIEAQGESGLVNFERFQTAAMITKSLLRLLDASARYIFKPEAECLSRCLWLAALEDAEIGEIGLELE